MDQKCVLCAKEAVIKNDPIRDGYLVNCMNCGRYIIGGKTNDTIAKEHDKEQLQILSRFTKEANTSGRRLILSNDTNSITELLSTDNLTDDILNRFSEKDDPR